MNSIPGIAVTFIVNQYVVIRQENIDSVIVTIAGILCNGVVVRITNINAFSCITRTRVVCYNGVKRIVKIDTSSYHLVANNTFNNLPDGLYI
ncbi:unnamed protein product, partial [marine sediment metagenome]